MMGREVEELAEQVADRDRLVEVARNECAECEAAVAERLGELERDRADAAAKIPEKVMTIFDDVAEQNEGETLAAVIEVSKRHREYSCGACHVQMPYYLVVNLHDPSTGVQQCPNCNRILHLETAETEAS
jgi:predicted  nucleic acid-binding Zn-ribbon protein